MEELIAPQGDAKPDLANRWKTWLTDPVNRASLMQTGIALLQPMAMGQMPLGHIANAVGEGAALQGRYQEALGAERDRELKRQAEERATREAEARIANYGVEADLAKGRLQLGQEEIAAAREGRVWNRERDKTQADLERERLAIERQRLESSKTGTKSPTLTQLLAKEKFDQANASAKPKWIIEQAEKAAAAQFVDPLALVNDPKWYAEASQTYDRLFNGAGTGAGAGASGGAPGGAPLTYKGTPVTESDISRFMAATGYTREQVMEILKGQP